MLVDDADERAPAREWSAEQDSDSGADWLAGRQEARAVRPLHQRPQERFETDFGEKSREQHLHVKPRGPLPQMQSNMSPMPQQDLSERQVGVIPKQRIYDMNPGNRQAISVFENWIAEWILFLINFSVCWIQKGNASKEQKYSSQLVVCVELMRAMRMLSITNTSYSE